MAKTSSIQRNDKRIKLAAKYNSQRLKLKKIIRSETVSQSEKDDAIRAMQAIPGTPRRCGCATAAR